MQVYWLNGNIICKAAGLLGAEKLIHTIEFDIKIAHLEETKNPSVSFRFFKMGNFKNGFERIGFSKNPIQKLHQTKH